MALRYHTKLRFMAGRKEEAKAILPLISYMLGAEAKLFLYDIQKGKYIKAKDDKKITQVYSFEGVEKFEKVVNNRIRTYMNIGYLIEFIVK